mgnify:CR=1 FL=1
MSHTPEPWRVRMDTSAPNVFITREFGVDVPPAFYIADVQGIGKKETEANAARIVACVNGCTGLNPAAYREIIEAAKCLFTTHRQENDWDRLRKALTHAQEQP